MTKTKLNRVVFNSLTGEESIIPLTDEEIAQLEVDRAKAEADRAERDAAEAAKAASKASAEAKLAALGITAEEAKLLLS